MAVVRHYLLRAAEGRSAALSAALLALAQEVRALPGCSGVECLIDTADADRFVFIERWDSVEAHKAAGALLPKAAMAPVMAALADRPTGSYLAPVAQAPS
jgi:quinol monooxygenase YgiN